MSNFKIAVVAIFVIFTVLGIGVFAFSKGGVSSQSANLTVWGTQPATIFSVAYDNSSLKSNKDIKITYVEKNPATFDQEFVESLADGRGPDIVLLREDSVYKNRNKLFVIPYKNYNERTFKDTFIEEGELFLSPEGVIALPFIVDPMVMYWNRDLFSNALVAQTPKYWDGVLPLIEKITRKDSGGNVLQSAVALGEWRNISNAKEIISAILLQSGTPITARNSSGVVSSLSEQYDFPTVPSVSGINFYTQYSNPTVTTYTWNRSLPTSFNFFLSGNLATYFGFASELFSIQQKNPNLNFNVTEFPQIRNSKKKVVFAHMYLLSIVKQSRQIAGAYVATVALTEPSAIKALETVTSLPPVRRDLLANQPSDAFRTVFYNSALLSSSWVDPDPKISSNIFRDMIESITSGRKRVSEAVSDANDELNEALK